ncbi:MAG: Uma2 family endonuclease [Cytophagia bacterium]|nr:MAG: Uma2 family endonuclease [Runella sp.]TAG16731.1 MAG: Uma2 family endonuclease [Cytophagales bacterium]TAG34771.1 MAG: Uma2 family endonuclease [Cytophagia bacterium]TAG58922.1 MAG: Uma2 family endonuclease [Runella slithyformis]TAG76826.1 MAG: Uma2 family endonuclease [Cytophagales bacterium]
MTETQIKVSVEDYLETEYTAFQRSEYLNGEVRMMAYASEEHELIIANLVRLLGNCLIDSDCRVYPSNRMLHIPECNRFYYAGAIVVCGPTEFYNYKKKMKATLNPSIIIEVLSDSTEDYDRHAKWHCYQKIKSLKQYILVSQNELYLESFQRIGDLNEWLFTSADQLEQILKIGNCELSLRDIYANVFPAQTTPPAQ